MGYGIKKLLANDIRVARQLIQLFETEFEDKKPLIRDDNYLQDLLSKDNFHVFVAVENENVVGGLTAYELQMFSEEKKEVFLYDIAVAKNHWKNGIAKELINALKKTCLEKGIKTIFVGTDTDNLAAKGLYEATGAEMEEVAWFTYNLER